MSAPVADLSVLGALELLVLQPTPFCNIDCSYCYLPDRSDRRRMPPEVMVRVFERVFESGLVRHPFTVLWHAGEPLVLPPRYYEDAIALCRKFDPDGAVCHSFQTNATLIDQGWCDFFRAHQILLGVSVDGPAFLHDRHRRTRSGRGTHEQVLRGIRLLNDNGIPYRALSVLTAPALDYPDELFDFYQGAGIRRVAFNVEEVEGPHTRTSLEGPDAPERFRRFLSRFLDLAERADPPLLVREEEEALGLIYCGTGRGGVAQESMPFAILNVDCAGNCSTFSPEMLGLSSPRHGSFALGNLMTESLAALAATPHYRALADEVAAGVDHCRRTCPYFDCCGSRTPGNKYFENGSFATSETLSCRLHTQAVLDVVLDRLERRRQAAKPPAVTQPATVP
jgi:uncharacterized protein